METFRNKGRNHSMILELFIVANHVRNGIKYDKKNNGMKFWSKEDKKKILCERGQTTKVIGKKFEASHNEVLIKQKC
jgi:hypothetical protein